MDDYDLDDLLDMADDGWLYVEDEFALADELAEGQLANPGYSGTNYEIDLESWDFDLFDYWEDLEYADDAYWDSVSVTSFDKYQQHAGQKRRRDGANQSGPNKRHKSQAVQPIDRDAEPLVFRSREERNRSFFCPPPYQDNAAKFAFIPDWKERFATKDGAITNTQMPAAMRRAAEGQEHDTERRQGRQAQEVKVDEDMQGSEEWEDDNDDEAEEEGGLAIDPEMLKAVLRDKLGAAGLEGLDEATFMQTIQKMLSGEGDDAARELTDALLGKVTSDAGDGALSGWLSQQGVSLEEADEEADDEAANGEVSEELPKHAPRQSHRTTQVPLKSESPPPKSKKRAAPNGKESNKRLKKVKFEVTHSSSNQPEPATEQDQDEEAPTSDDPLNSEQTVGKISKAKSANMSSTKSDQAESGSSAENSTGRGRKRKAMTEEPPDSNSQARKKKSRDLESLGALPDAEASPAPPAKRTRGAKARAGK